MVDVKIEGNVIYTFAKQKLTPADYERLLPQLEQLVKQHGKIRWYFEMEDFHGWEPRAAWQDLKFDLSHARNLEKIAMVGDKDWEKWLSNIMKPFTPAEIKFFHLADAAQAKAWIAA